jgi:hypothetical protein
LVDERFRRLIPMWSPSALFVPNTVDRRRAGDLTTVACRVPRGRAGRAGLCRCVTAVLLTIC